MNQGSDNFGREQLKKHYEESSVLIHFLLMFHCYLLIIVNELRVNILKFNYLKI